MKRFIGISVLSVLAVWVILKALAVSPAEASFDNTQVKEIGEMQKAIQSGNVAFPVICADIKIAPLFDATGAVVSDPTGTMLDPSQSDCTTVSGMGVDVKIAPIFDATGAVVSDPTGTILNLNPSGDIASLVMGHDVKIAPVFDATGSVVSDPTGTILSVDNP
jgi:hypothetical protein